jgi:hypothetical protein
MDANVDLCQSFEPAPTHVQATAVLGDRTVPVDAPLVPLIEALHDRGFTTIYSCQETAPRHGRWIDEPDKPRSCVCFPDVDQLCSLLPPLERSETLARSIRPCLDSPRWEYLLSHHEGDTGSVTGAGPFRLQVSVFIPIERLDLLVDSL